MKTNSVPLLEDPRLIPAITFKTQDLISNPHPFFISGEFYTNTNGEGIIHGRLNASWKICSLVVNGQSF